MPKVLPNREQPSVTLQLRAISGRSKPWQRRNAMGRLGRKAEFDSVRDSIRGGFHVKREACTQQLESGNCIRQSADLHEVVCQRVDGGTYARTKPQAMPLSRLFIAHRCFGRRLRRCWRGGRADLRSVVGEFTGKHQLPRRNAHLALSGYALRTAALRSYSLKEMMRSASGSHRRQLTAAGTWRSVILGTSTNSSAFSLWHATKR